MIVRIALQDVLDKKKISQHQLAKLTDIPQPAINLMCKNKSVRFPLDRLARICEVLECQISDILILEKEPTD
ncbi:helix-turn-helix domain-containing protein [Psychrobacillus vulpis]|uniref:Helix-turn-helix transcriptional regulator n=1 Tax=Psychrobacillus vulpis TaxID=2325572 RepID=A0A544TWF3_9BACI|nr:helix-turn-helix transcriptional regulator [Psychrobacillus vulpis]TQR21785.1 helix-turn-helix transcriptional regulator [Psychrobacillus vulpis]